MKFEILDTKIENNGKTCYLCKATLISYLENLPANFKEYDIQRGIVVNSYLDNLIDTIFGKKHIPSIVIVSDKVEKNDKMLRLQNYKILDGLQRTFRLKIIYDTYKMYKEEYQKDQKILTLTKMQMLNKYKEQLILINSSIKLLVKFNTFLQSNDINKLDGCFIDNYQWFDIWIDLKPEDEIEKMLILNAGHKPVSLRHQLELLFFNILPHINTIKTAHENFKLIREKDTPSAQFVKQRKIGEFHLSHLISSILSFIETEPITTNASLINKIQSDKHDIDKNDYYFDLKFIDNIIKFLLTVDENINQKYKEIGIKWISRETVMVGIFAALGKYSTNSKKNYEEAFNKFLELLLKSTDLLNIKKYDEERDTMSVSKVNIGNITKNIIFTGVYNLLISEIPEPIDWKFQFNKYIKKNNEN